MILSLTSAQAKTLCDYLDAELNTVSVSQGAAYGDIIINRYSTKFSDSVRINPRGEWMGDVKPPVLLDKSDARAIAALVRHA